MPRRVFSCLHAEVNMIETAQTAHGPQQPAGAPSLPTMTEDGVLTIAGKTYVTPERFAQQMRVHVRTIRRWEVQRIGPPMVRIGRLALIDMDGVPAWLERHQTAPKGEASKSRTRSRSAAR